MARVPDQFEENLVAMLPHVQALGRYLTKNADAGDDLAQDVMMRALKARDSFIPGTNLRAWLFMIARNQFFSEKRRCWRSVTMPVTEDGTSIAELVLTSKPAQQDCVEAAEVVEAMRYLPGPMAEAILCVAEGLEYEEAAEELGCATGTVKSRVSRGRRELEAYFGLNLSREST